MARFVCAIAVMIGLVLSASGPTIGSSNYERTYPPRIMAVTAEVRSFYLEFRARADDGGFGHSYVVLGTVEATGEVRETVVAGFMSKGADDDYWDQFGIPVTGTVGVVRLDFTRRPAARFRIVVSKVEYYRVVREIYRLRKTWTTYELLLQNCNNFVGQIAASVGLRTPLVTAQYPVRYVTELRALNSR
jgi:hypothetical protein